MAHMCSLINIVIVYDEPALTINFARPHDTLYDNKTNKEKPFRGGVVS